ncbi:MAG: hypothetical protein FJZ01_03090 [Candidatus Sericytochromatia bacterium]|nr:hypothetical protein [Candidatus Tanganyikabacteria bacterium]
MECVPDRVDVRLPLPLISAAVVFHLAGLAGQNLPDSALRHRLLAVTGPYMTFFGLDQTWNMFSPQPGDTNLDLVAEVRLADGSTRTYRFPEMGKQGFLATYRSIPLRKLLLELGDHPFLLPDVARFVAARVGAPAAPVSVSLAYHWWRYPPPEIGLRTAYRYRKLHRLDLGTYPVVRDAGTEAGATRSWVGPAPAPAR